MKKIKTSYLFPLSFVFITACTQAPATYTVETVDGVRYVNNLAKNWGDKPKIELQFVQQIGDIDAEDEAYIFASPSGVVVDAQQNIYISDFKSHHIQKYSKKGRYIKTIGSEGQGPGEIQYPSSLAFGPNNTLYTGWYSNRKLHAFDLEGDYKQTITVEHNIDELKILSDGRMAIFDPWGLGKSTDEKLIKILDANGKLLNAFGDQSEPMGWNPPNENTLELTTDNEDNIYITLQHQNRIEKYSPDGKLLMTIKRNKRYEEEIHKERKGGKDKDGKYISIPAANVFSWGINIDHKERIWVLSPKRQLTVERITDNSYLRNYEFEVYTPDGILLGTLDIEQFKQWGWFEIYGDRLFIWDRVTEVDVKEYKIVDLN